MRGIGAGFGLVAFMIAIAVSLWMWGSYNAEVAKYGIPAQRQAEQMAGQDEHGRLAINSIGMAPEIRNGQLKYVLIDRIDPQGSYAKYFHLQLNDTIVRVNAIDLRGEDEEMAKALIQQAYQMKWEMIVVRNGQKISLPEGTVIEGNVSMAEFPSVKPTTQPAAKAADGQERAVRKELAPLQGILK